VAFVRGRNFDYGEDFDCGRKDRKNWIAIYNPATGVEKALFDRPLSFGRHDFTSCVFEQMQLSHDGGVLYLVSPVYATSGALAIVDLARGSAKYVPGVDEVYVIETGPHRDELIWYERIYSKTGADDWFVHARADGARVAKISNEHLKVGGNDEVPLLRKYLRNIGGSITISGERLP